MTYLRQLIVRRRYDVGFMSKVDEFRCFVQPVYHTSVSPFIQEFCGITDDDLRIKGMHWQDCLDRFEHWCLKHNVTAENTTIVTCGDWDLKTMLTRQLAITKTRLSERLQKLFYCWTNMKRTFADAVKSEKLIGMDGMLKHFQMELVGRHHCGIDDCRNIGRIVRELVRKGHDVTKPNSMRQIPYYFGGTKYFYRKGSDILPNQTRKVVFMS